MDFYVYIHRKPNGDIFYVGKGTKKRAWSKHSRNSYWTNVYNKYKSFDVEIIADNLQEWYAFELESELIMKYREQYALCNIVDYGGGNGGYVFNEQDLQKMRVANSGNNNGRADSTIYQFINIVSNEEFKGTRCDFQKKYGFRISDLFNNKVLTVYSWCLKSNADKVGTKIKYDPREYVFENLQSGQVIKATRREFDKISGISSKSLFSGKLKSLHGWVVKGLFS